MIIKPISIKKADEFTAQHHRHNKPRGNGKFAIGAYCENKLIGIAIGGRPSARMLDNGITFEVYRVCTDGTKNATSFLYSRMKRIAQLMGYEKIITYTLQSESGSSLRAIGGVIEAEVTHNRFWNSSNKITRNNTSVSLENKYRYVI
jgi:hypothetical protein